MIEIQLQRLPHGEGLPAPSYASDGAAGLDVVAAEDLDLAPGQRHAVATGFAIAIPEGYEVQVRPRSGLALKHGITCLNSPGTIDHDYRGEVKVILANLGAEPFEVRRGERIAQLVPAPVTKAHFSEVAELGETGGRSSGGFGSPAGDASPTTRARTLCAAHRPAAGRRGWTAQAQGGAESRSSARAGSAAPSSRPWPAPASAG